MSFLNKIKGWGQKDDGAEGLLGAGQAFEVSAPHGAHLNTEGPATDVTGAPAYDVPTMQQTADLDTSIITEAAPSEMADFSETRIQDGDLGSARSGTGVPLIGGQPVATQQRILFIMVGIGLIG